MTRLDRQRKRIKRQLKNYKARRRVALWLLTTANYYVRRVAAGLSPRRRSPRPNRHGVGD